MQVAAFIDIASNSVNDPAKIRQVCTCSFQVGEVPLDLKLVSHSPNEAPPQTDEWYG